MREQWSTHEHQSETNTTGDLLANLHNLGVYAIDRTEPGPLHWGFIGKTVRRGFSVGWVFVRGYDYDCKLGMRKHWPFLVQEVINAELDP